MRKHIKTILASLALVFAGTALSAQGDRVTFAQAPRPETGYKGMFLRWSQPELTSSPQLHIYRQEEGSAEWKRITETPWGYGRVKISPAERKADPELDALMEITAKVKSGTEKAGLMKGFALYRSITNPQFGMHLGVLYNDSTAEAGKRYRYEVRELKGQAERPFAAASTYQTAGDYQQARSAEGIRHEAGDQIARITWTPDEYYVSYNLYFTTTKGAQKTLMNQDPIMQTKTANEVGAMVYPEWLFVKDKLVNGTTYYFELSRVDIFGNESRRSAEFEVTPRDQKPPKAPRDLALSHTGPEVTLKWEAENEADLAGFYIYRANVSGDTSLNLVNRRPLAAADRSFKDIVPDLNTVYVYIVEAADQSDNRQRSKVAYIQVYDLAPPKTPQGLTARADTGTVYLSWSANTENDLKGYKVYRGLEGQTEDKYVCLTSKAVTGTTYTDVLPKRARNKFSYRITAVDTVFNESAKTEVVAAQMPDIVPPQAPFLTGIKAEGKTITMQWMPGLESDLWGYRVERALHDADTAQWVSVTPNPLAKTAISFTDRAVVPGVHYYYRVQALDISRNTSPHSNVYMGFVADVKMAAAPQGLVGSLASSAKGVELRWDIAKSSDLKGCMVFRKEGDAEFLPISGLLQENRFTDPAPRKGKTCYYVVRAFDHQGNAAASNVIPFTIPQESNK